MKPLSERDENTRMVSIKSFLLIVVGMKPLSERDENSLVSSLKNNPNRMSRNEATL